MTTASGVHTLGPVLLFGTFYFKICSSQENMTTTDYESEDSSSLADSFDYSQFSEQCQKQSNRDFRNWFTPTVYTLICLLGLLGNTLVILTYFYYKRLKTMTDVYLLSLAVADLLFALTLPFWALNAMARWDLGLPPCKALFTVYKASFFSGMFLLACISVDRYLAIAKAVAAHRLRSRAVLFGKLSAAGAWVLALLFAAPEMTYTRVGQRVCTPYSNNSDQLRVGIQAGQMAAGFVVPALVMGFCYCGIVRTLARSRSFERNKAVRVVLAVVAVFVLGQAPYNVVLLLTTVDAARGGSKDCRHENALMFAADVTQGLAFLRCCLNPFVYAFVGVKFRSDLFKLLKELGCVSQQRYARYAHCGRRRSSTGADSETTTTFSP